MNRSIFLTLLGAGLFFFSTTSFALFKGYVGAGYTFGEVEIGSGSTAVEAELDGLKYAAGFYIQPVPLVPVGIGATGEFANFGEDDGLDKRRLFSLRPELTAWLPLVKIKKLKPFVKLGYTLGWMNFEGSSVDTDLKVSGLNAGLGLGYKPLPLLELLLLYNIGFEKAEISDLSVSGVASSFVQNGDEGDYKNHSILLSVQAGI